MTTDEFRAAVPKAKRILFSANIRADSTQRASVNISKKAAMGLVNHLPDNAKLKADWIDGADHILMIGY